MRATRDLLRRRMPLTRNRAEWRAPIQNTNRPDNLPEIGKQLAYTAHRPGVAERVPAPAVQKSREVDLARLGAYDPRLREVAGHILNAAQQHDAQTLYGLHPGPGIGTILRLVRWDERHDIQRLPRGQDVVSSCRLGKGAKASAGKRDGCSGTKIGNAALQGAFSKAAVLFLRDHPAGQQSLTKLEKKHGQGTALPGLAQTLARAVYDRLTRQKACDMQKFLQGEGSGAREPSAALAVPGLSLSRALGIVDHRASGTPQST